MLKWSPRRKPTTVMPEPRRPSAPRGSTAPTPRRSRGCRPCAAFCTISKLIRPDTSSTASDERQSRARSAPSRSPCRARCGGRCLRAGHELAVAENSAAAWTPAGRVEHRLLRAAAGREARRAPSGRRGPRRRSGRTPPPPGRASSCRTARSWRCSRTRGGAPRGRPGCRVMTVTTLYSCGASPLRQ